jgi:hypothetical protein
VTTYIFNILLFIISQLTFTNSFNYASIFNSDDYIISSEEIIFFSLDIDEYSDTVDDETSKHDFTVDLNNEITPESQSIIIGKYLDETSDNLTLLNKYIDLPPPSIS